MSNAEILVEEPRRISPGLLHLAFFSALFLMLVAALPAPSLGYGTCSGKVAGLEGPLLPAVA